MDNRLVKSQCGVVEKLSTNNLQIRLLGHCIICLRKLNLNRKSNQHGTSKSFRNIVADGASAPPEIAPKSIVSTPGFLATFNQVWAVIRTKWKNKNDTNTDRNFLYDQIEISLENVMKNDSCSANVSFSKAPTICQVCCDKVLGIENLMKAVRQQVREISMLLEEGRSRKNGRMGAFEKNLWENTLEENVIKATLQFVGIWQLPISASGNFKVTKDDDELYTKADTVVDVVDLEFQEDNSLASSQISDNDECQSGEDFEDVNDDDPDYIKSEEELEDDDNFEDESEEEMEVDQEEDKNDPDFDVEKDPLAIVPKKRKKYNVTSTNWANKFSSSDDKKTNPDNYKFTCTCGKIFGSKKTLRYHMSRNPNIHPEYKPFEDSIIRKRQTCELCGKKVMFSDNREHLTGVHLNGQDEWIMRCPNEKCSYLYVSSKEFHLHFFKENCKECKKIWREKGGPVCEICGFRGTNMLKLRCHVRDKHESGKEKKWKCPISDCGKMFAVKQSVHDHLHEHQYRPPITEQLCDKCGEKLKVEEMEGHLREEHGILEVIGCKQCGMKFSGRDEMVEHLYDHLGTFGISCDICGEDSFARYADFRKHYFGVHKLCPKKYKCGEGDNPCDLGFWRKEDKERHELKRHRTTDSGTGRQTKKWAIGERRKDEKEFECELCNVQFVKEDTLISHNIKLHGADPYKCEICGETFEYRHKFTKHKKEHAGIVFQKEWICEVEGCGKTFKARKRWKHHVEFGHEGKRPHVCEICGKGYGSSEALKTHRDSVHLGLRPCVCDECGEAFTSSSTLKRHKRIHTGERPFGCEICGQRFRHKEVLKRHVEGHEEKGAGFKPNGPMKQIRKRKTQ